MMHSDVTSSTQEAQAVTPEVLRKNSLTVRFLQLEYPEAEDSASPEEAKA
jgi:hypothetical protein